VPEIAVISSWRELPFREIWCVDFEYYPGQGFANDGREGDRITPLCVVARYFDDRGLEMWNTVTRLLAKLEARSA
jgi:hypothetical protein